MTASYIYALIRPIDTAGADLSTLRGIDGAEVRLVTADGLAALVSSVDDGLFEPAAVEEKLGNLAWLEAVARAHDSVVNAAAAKTTTIPLRLGTTCSDDGSVKELLADLAPAAHRVLARLDGHCEWGVQFVAQREPASAPAPADESGAAFLRRRRSEIDGSRSAQQQQDAEADKVYEALSAVSTDARRLPLHDRRVSTDGRSVVLNAAFLVAADHADAFRSTVHALAAAHGEDRVVLTGPWAPYSFAELKAP